MSLNYIIVHQLSDLKIIINSPILITGFPSLKDDETATNMWCVSFDDNILESFSKEQFEEFVVAIIENRKQQITQMYNSLPSTFYMWFDEMAVQLRFNILSGHAIQLPFGCHVEIVDSIESIWQEFKDSRHQEGISWSELEFFEDDIDDDEEEYILKVYVKNI
jgi:hypothetical protein